MIVYGIPNCDTIKKARRWLGEHELAYTFHDYKKSGIDRDRIAGWAGQVGWESLVNQRGTTWRKLDEAARKNLDEAKAIDLMVANTSLIKRPVVEHGDLVLVGFDATMWIRLLMA